MCGFAADWLDVKLPPFHGKWGVLTFQRFSSLTMFAIHGSISGETRIGWWTDRHHRPKEFCRQNQFHEPILLTSFQNKMFN